MSSMSNFPINCKKCRIELFNTADFPTINCHHKKTNDIEVDLAHKDCQTLNNGNTLFLNEEPFPSFISEAIENSGWQKGKLLCPKCNVRIGSFNFVNSMHCSCSHSLVPSVNLHSSKVDFIIPTRTSSSKSIPEEQVPLNDNPGQISSHENEQLCVASPCLSPEVNDDVTEQKEALESTQMNVQVRDPCQSSNSSACVQSYTPVTVMDNWPHLLRAQTDEELSTHQNNQPSLRRRHPSSPSQSTNSDGFILDPSEIDDSADESCEIPDRLICAVCLDLLFNPFKVQPCDHIFCESCLRKLAKATPDNYNTSCPLCREFIGICFPCPVLNKELKSKYSKQQKERHQFEKLHNCQHLPLPWMREYRFFGFRYGRTNARVNYGRNWVGWRTLALIFILDCVGMTLMLILNWAFEDYKGDIGEVEDKQQRILDTPQTSVELQGSYPTTPYMNARDLLISMNETVYSSVVD